MATMKVANRKPRPKSDKTAPPPAEKIQISIDPSQDTPTFYANFFEVGRTTHDLVIYGARVPAKLRPDERARAVGGGTLELQAEFQIVIPPTLAPGLIRAIQSQIGDWVSAEAVAAATAKRENP